MRVKRREVMREMLWGESGIGFYKEKGMIVMCGIGDV